MADAKDIKVAWVSGNLRQRKATLLKIKAMLGQHDLFVYGEEVGFDYFEQQVISQDCFGEKKLVLLTSLPIPNGTKETMKSHLKKLVDHVPQNTLLVFYGIPPSSEKAIFNHVEKIGKVFEFDQTVSPVDAERLVLERLGELNKAIELKDASMLVKAQEMIENKTYDVDMLNVAIDKLLSYVSNRKKIETADVAAIVVQHGQFNIWKFFDVLDECNYLTAFETLQNLFISSDKPSEVVEHQLMPLLIWRYKLFFMLKEAQGLGWKHNDIISRIGGLNKLKFEGKGFQLKTTSESKAYSEGIIQRALGNAFSNPLENLSKLKIRRIVEFLAIANEQMRLCKRDAEFKMIANMFLLLACDKIDDTRMSKLWSYFEHE